MIYWFVNVDGKWSKPYTYYIVDMSACWTIDGQKRCGEDFTYENEKIKVEKKGRDTNIYLK